MEQQEALFETRSPTAGKPGPVPDLERYQAAMLFSAVGDALGWPTEFLREKPGHRPSFDLPVRDFVRWPKMVGGRWWGYREEIAPGEYSDDTQLTLAVARSISSSGDFEPERFAYGELPLWLHYERGGGKSIKAAARALLRPNADWLHNFYKHGELDYRQAGANGAAMRNLPIALSAFGDEKRVVRDSFLNAIITHGHPRAILGTILFGLAVRHALSQNGGGGSQVIEYLRERIEALGRFVADDTRVGLWIQDWDKRGAGKGSFKASFAETRQEGHSYLSAVEKFPGKATADYYRFVGALSPATKGSGLATVCAAIFLFLRYADTPTEAIYEAVNQLGSDTDTIASFLGALLGARHGLGSIPQHLRERVQDRDYLLKTGKWLHGVAAGEPSDMIPTGKRLERDESYLSILAWEIGLHEMFWDALEEGSPVLHPALGRGTITSKEVKKIPREGHVAKLFRIRFDCGQTCVFHSRVENNEKVSESLAREVQDALKQTGVKKPLTIYDLGWTLERAKEVRSRLAAFAEDWDDPTMDIYDED